jgi:hypothetical protein
MQVAYIIIMGHSLVPSIAADGSCIRCFYRATLKVDFDTVCERKLDLQQSLINTALRVIQQRTSPITVGHSMPEATLADLYPIRLQGYVFILLGPVSLLVRRYSAYIDSN